MVDFYTGTIVPWAVRYAPQDFQGCTGQLLQLNQYQALYSLVGIFFGGDGRSTFGLPNLVNRVMLGSTSLGTSSAVPGPNAVNGATGGFFHPQMNVTTSGQFTLNANQIPGHTHPATFAATTASVPVTVSAPSGIMNVTIPVGTTTPSNGPPQPLTGNVSLMNATAGANLRGLYTTGAPGPTVSLAGVTATGTPGGTFTGNVTTVTGGNVTVSQNTGGSAVSFTANGATTVVSGSTSGNMGLPLPPYQAIGFMIAVQGIYPVNPN